MQSCTSWHSRHSLEVGYRLYPLCSSCKRNLCSLFQQHTMHAKWIISAGEQADRSAEKTSQLVWPVSITLRWFFFSVNERKWLSNSRRHWLISPRPIKHILDSSSDHDLGSVCPVTEFLPKTNFPEHNSIPQLSCLCSYITGLSWNHLQGKYP